MERPFFSVVIPVYNKKNHVSRAVDSVLSQSFCGYEVIIIDDASTDGSSEVINRYRFLDNVRIYNRENPGPGGYAARNLGVEKSNGEWVTFLDADDVWDDDNLEGFYDAIVDNSCLFYFRSYRKAVAGGEKTVEVYPESRAVERKDLLEKFLKSDVISMNAVCMSKELFESLGGFPVGRFRRGGDAYFWLNVVLNIDVAIYLKKPASTWMAEHSEVTKSHLNINGIHPVSVLLEDVLTNGRVEKENILLLRKIANRKELMWAVDKKLKKMSFSENIRALSYGSMSFRQYLKVATILLPFKSFVLIRKKLL